MQEVLEGGPGSGSGAEAGAGALPGEIAGLQMDDTVLMEVEVLLRAAAAWFVEEEDEEEPALETTGGVNCPLLSEPVLSLAGDDFFLAGRALALLPLCACCRHFARRFLNHT